MFIKFINFSSNIVLPTGSTEILLSDYFRESTRKSRQWLLTSALIGLFITIAHIVPTKISAIGVEFNSINQASFLKVSSFVPLYFLITFLIYGLCDCLHWISNLMKNRQEYYCSIKESSLKKDDEYEPSEIQLSRAEHVQREYIDPIQDTYFLSSPIVVILVIIKLVWELLFPLLLGVYSIGKLWTYF